MAKKKRKNNVKVSLKIAGILLMGFALGFATKVILPKDYSPPSLVWVADETVNAPSDLLSYIEKETADDCVDYNGTYGDDGVALTSVYKVVQGKYAKVAIGCGSSLSGGSDENEGFPIIKTDSGWKMFSAANYYIGIDNGTNPDDPNYEVTNYPRCSIVDKYKVSKEFTPDCYKDHGENPTETDHANVRAVAYP